MTKPLGRVTLDLDRLLAKGEIDNALATRLNDLKEGSAATNYLVSVLYIIGALAAAAGVVLLKPTATTGLVIAIVCLIAGQYIRWQKWEHLNILALALGIGSTAGLSGWFALEFGETLPAITVTGFSTLVTLIMAMLFRSRFLIALVPLGIGSMIGSGGGYWHAAYGIFVRESTITIAVFTVLTIALYGAVRWLMNSGADWSPMANVASRMSLIISNFGFWVGSLWGDYVGDHMSGAMDKAKGQDWEAFRAARNAFRDTALHVPENAFVIGWAAFAVLLILIGNKLEQKFISMCGIVFLAINAFTQYFEYFQNEPWALVFGGIALVAVALTVVRFEMDKKEALTE